MNGFTMIFSLMLLMYNFIYVPSAKGATITAASCSQGDVQAAIDSSKDGDIVMVPAGTSRWSTFSDNTPSVFIYEKAITLQGAGIDQTIIIDATGNAWKEIALWIEGAEGKPFRVTGFTFNEGSDTHGVILIAGDCKNFRVDHCKFESSKNRGITTRGYTYGVIDHCTFKSGSDILIKDTPPGDDAWQRYLTLGTANAVYVEDCNFEYNAGDLAAIDAQAGGRYVFRYNIVNNAFTATHGTESGYPERGVVSFEIYENTFTSPINWFTAILLRGGTGVVFNNIANGYQSMIRVNNYRSWGSYGEWGRCDGSSLFDGNSASDSGSHTGSDNQSTLICSGTSWTTNEWIDYVVRNETDSSSGTITANTTNTITATLSRGTENDWDNGDNFIITNGYPCFDQIGRSTDSGPGTPQKLEPLYEWGNTLNGADGDISVPNECVDHIKENRDYYNDTQRPCYTPYTYPHPLTMISPPTNLRFIKD